MRARATVCVAIGFLGALSPTAGCGPVRRYESQFTEGITRKRPLRLERIRDADGNLTALRLSGSLHLYRRAFDGEKWNELPPHRELVLVVDQRIDLDGLAPDERVSVPVTFLKLSPYELGPRFGPDEQLEWRLDGRRLRFDAGFGLDSNHRYFRVWSEVHMSLTNWLTIARASDVRGRLASYSSFTFTPAEKQILVELARELESRGWRSAPPRETDDEPIHSGAGGMIWGTRDHRLFGLADHSSLTLVSTFAGRYEYPFALRPPNWISYPEERPETPLVGKMRGNEGDVVLSVPSPSDRDSYTAYRLATIACDLLRELFRCDTLPETYVFVYPMDEKRACRFSHRTKLGRGVAIGVPSVHGEIDDETAHTFLWLLAHEYAEGLLVIRELGAECELYARDRRNRWIGDGVAELVASFADERARQEGLRVPPAEAELQLLLNALRAGQDTVKLSDWRVHTRGPKPREGGDRDSHSDRTFRHDEHQSVLLRYAAAEYLMAKWHRAASAHREGPPLAAFVKWLRSQRGGPEYGQVVGWLDKSAGLGIRLEAEDVAIIDVLRYTVEKWKRAGLTPSPQALRALEVPGHSPESQHRGPR